MNYKICYRKDYSTISGRAYNQRITVYNGRQWFGKPKKVYMNQSDRNCIALALGILKFNDKGRFEAGIQTGFDGYHTFRNEIKDKRFLDRNTVLVIS